MIWLIVGYLVFSYVVNWFLTPMVARGFGVPVDGFCLAMWIVSPLSWFPHVFMVLLILFFEVCDSNVWNRMADLVFSPWGDK